MVRTLAHVQVLVGTLESMRSDLFEVGIGDKAAWAFLRRDRLICEWRMAHLERIGWCEVDRFIQISGAKGSLRGEHGILTIASAKDGNMCHGLIGSFGV